MISVIVDTNFAGHTIISETFQNTFQLCRCSNCFVISLWEGWMVPFNTGYVPGFTVVESFAFINTL